MSNITTPPPANLTAGWYPDQTMNNTQRYWDGVSWTSHIAPAPPTVAPAAAPDADISHRRTAAVVALVIVGIVVGLVSSNIAEADAPLLLAVATPFIIVEMIAKILEFTLRGTPDWFAMRFEEVRLSAASSPLPSSRATKQHTT